jgi:putative tricarboxylic transport membrane protein
MLVIERFLIPLFTKILEVPDRIVMVIVIMMCYLGTYNSQRSVTDLILFAVSGLVGYLLEVCNIQLAPVILGFILGPITERYMRQALMVSKLSVAPLFQRPISLTFIIIAVIAFAHAFYQRSKRKRQDQDA